LPQQVVLSSLRHPKDAQSDSAFLLTTLGQLWLAGITINWSAFHAHEQRQRLPLPTYPFERRRYWIEPVKSVGPNLKIWTPAGDDEPHADSVPRHSRSYLSTTYLVPSTPLEQTLTAIWQEFFNIEPIGIQDDFFELGGDSLLIVQLATQLRKVLQVPLAAHHLLKTPTIATLAAAIAQLTSANQVQATLPFSLVELQAGNSQRTPLFLVHPAEGQVYVYRDLARCLGPEQPVYGLQAAGLEKHTDPVTSIAAMATDYIKALQVRQPEGPYWLGGSSFGGTCALEMAQQLLATGQKVALLTLLDTPRLDNRGISAEILGDDLNLLAALLRMSDDFAISLDEIRTLPQEKQLTAYLEQYAKVSKKTFALTALEDMRYLLRLFRTNYQSMVDYHPQRYPDHIVFFSASDRDETNPPHPERGWLELVTGGIEVYEVPGNHITMNHSPHVEVIAKQLQKYLQLN
jgi:thioesterase domain-containing protein/acyl carrier protein